MNYLSLIIILCGQLFGDAMFNGNASDGENSLYLNTFDQIVGNPVDTPSEFIAFARQYGREDDGYSANDGNTYRVGRTMVDVIIEPESMPYVYNNQIDYGYSRRKHKHHKNDHRRSHRSMSPRRDAYYVPGGSEEVYVAAYD